MTINHVEKQARGREELDNIINSLNFMAEDFSHVGNEYISEKLLYLSSNLVCAQENYETAYNELFNEAFKATQQATTNMINAALAYVSKK